MTALDPIHTIVLLMLENRSFDHLLGHLSLPGVGRRSDVDGLSGDLDDQGQIIHPSYANPANGLIYWPYVLDEDERFHNDIPHDPHLIDKQIAHSEVSLRHAMNGFARAYFETYPGDRVDRCPALSIYPPHLAPMTSFLAEHYAVCDRWFTPIPTDTHPNRLVALSGYTRIEENRPWLLPEQDLVIDWLARHGVRWRVYTEGLSFIHLMRPSLLLDREHFRPVSRMAADFISEPDSEFPQVILIEPGYLDDPFVSRPNDNHPPLPMGPGEAFLRRIYQAVTANRERWQGTVFFVYYDEHGGFYDHVPPLPIVMPPPPGERGPAFATTGPRVPALVVSPLVEPGAVYHGHLDHTSVLRFLADKFTPGVPYSDLVDIRHSGPGDLTSAAAAITRSAPRAEVPAPPPMPEVPQPVLPTPRPTETAGQKIFEIVHTVARPRFADAMADLYES